MDILVVDNYGPRKEWTTPELKKIDIEEITAAATSGNDDQIGSS